MRRLRLVALAGLFAAALTAFPGTAGSQTPDYSVPLSYLTPIPIVRLVAQLTNTGARVTLLRVKAPKGSKIVVRCAGGKRKGCAVKSRSLTTKSSKAVRFKQFERRYRSGVQLRVFVRKGNTIGKYTRFKIRKHKSPSRVDSCLLPGDPDEPQACP